MSSEVDILRILAQSGVEFGQIDPDRVKPDELCDLPREEIGQFALTAKEVLRAVCLADPPSDDSLVDSELARVMENVGLIYGTYYVAAMKSLIEVNDSALSKGLIHPKVLKTINDRAEEFERFALDEDEVPFYRAQAFLSLVANHLFGTWVMMVLVSHTEGDPNAYLPTAARAEAVDGASTLAELRVVLPEVTPGLGMLLDAVVPQTFDALTDVLRAESGPAGIASVGYNALRLGDLNHLARRDAHVRESYGMTLERAFERQLSLLFTSLGFAVIESTPGRRYVDLVCIGSDSNPQTLVVEAKSTSRPNYEFRAADQRALVEHVEEVKRTLRGLPLIEVVILVAPGFSNGAASRIKEAERSLGIPCRGVTSELLVELRQRHLGPIPSALFIEQLCRSDAIVDSGVIDAILDITQAPTRGWQEFVNIAREANLKRR